MVRVVGDWRRDRWGFVEDVVKVERCVEVMWFCVYFVIYLKWIFFCFFCRYVSMIFDSFDDGIK